MLRMHKNLLFCMRLTDDISRDWLRRAVQYTVTAHDPELAYPELDDGLIVITFIFFLELAI